jgi:hypothetical protein
MGRFIFVLLIVCYFSGIAQHRKIYCDPLLPSLEYVYQGKHSLGTWLGLPVQHAKWPHSFLIPEGGGVFFYTNKRTYFSPGVSLELYHQLDKQKLPFGIYCRLSYTQHLVLGQTNRIISGDIGISNFYLKFFVGYNFNLQKEELQQFTPYRVGIKFL